MPASKNVLASNIKEPVIFRISNDPVVEHERSLIGLCAFGEIPDDAAEYAAILFNNKIPSSDFNHLIPWITLDFSGHPLRNGDVVQFIPSINKIYFLIQADEGSNALYVTDCCNSHCLMCPQPPQLVDRISFGQILRTIDCLPSGLQSLGITGGEPTLLKNKLVTILELCTKKEPEAELHILSNARLLKNFSYVCSLRKAGGNQLSFGVPLYSYTQDKHDYIVQSYGAFDETLQGIVNLGKCDIPVEIRIVLNKQTIPDLIELSRFIYFNFPFVYRVAFMGMENMGYVKKNLDRLWVSPEDYQDQLAQAIGYLYLRGIHVDIYNLPLCLLKNELRPFFRDSITPFKRSYRKECELCEEKAQCGGFFKHQISTVKLHPLVTNEECH